MEESLEEFIGKYFTTVYELSDFRTTSSALDLFFFPSNEKDLLEANEIKDKEGVYLGVSLEQNFTYLAEMNTNKPAYILDYSPAVILGILPVLMTMIFKSKTRREFLSMLTQRKVSKCGKEEKNLGELLKEIEHNPTSKKKTKEFNDIILNYILPHVGKKRQEEIRFFIDNAFSPFTEIGETYLADRIWEGFIIQDLPRKPGYVGWLSDEKRYQRIRKKILKGSIKGICGDWSQGKAIKNLVSDMNKNNLKAGVFYLSNMPDWIYTMKRINFLENLNKIPTEKNPLVIWCYYGVSATTTSTLEEFCEYYKERFKIISKARKRL